MKRSGQMGKRIISVLLAVLLGIGLAFTGYAPEAEAAGGGDRDGESGHPCQDAGRYQ